MKRQEKSATLKMSSSWQMILWDDLTLWFCSCAFSVENDKYDKNVKSIKNYYSQKSFNNFKKNVKAVKGSQWGSTVPFFPVLFRTGWGEMEVYMKCIDWLWGWFNAPGLTSLGKYFLLVDTTQLNSTFCPCWLASLEVISQVLFTSE